MERFIWTPTEPPRCFPRGYKVIRSNLENGRERRYYKHETPRKWILNFETRHSTMQEIVAFHRARRGSFEPFIWETPWEPKELVVVRFDEDQLDVETQWNERHDNVTGAFTVTLVEVL